MALEPGAMMKLRRELLLLRDGTAQETEIRTNKIAQLGRALEACATRRQFRGHETAVRTVAAGLLRHAAARADDECWSGADADFWKSHARAQFGAWKQLGACGHPGLLRGALEGWKRAFEAGGIEHPDDLAGQGEVQFFSGDYGGAATTLGRLVEATSGEGGGPERRAVILRVAMLYQHALDQHGQACALIFRLAENGGVPLFSNAGLLFLLARAYEDWSRRLSERRGSVEKKHEADKHASTASATYEKLYKANLSVGAFKRRVGGAPVDATAWLADAATWRVLADKCSFAGLDLYAADLYAEGARRDPDGAGRAHWYRLAKAQRRCGKHDAALGALRAAIDRAPGSTQLRAVESAWSNAEANDDDAHAVTIDAFLARLPPVGNDLAVAATALAAVARMWRQRKRAIYSKEHVVVENDERSTVTVEEMLRPASRQRPRTADIDTMLEDGLRSALFKEQQRAERLELRVARMEHEQEALAAQEKNRDTLRERYRVLQEESKRHKREAQKSALLVSSTRENLAFLTKALKLARSEADGLRSELKSSRRKATVAETRARNAETAVAEAHQEFERAMARSPSPESSVMSSPDRSLAQGSWEPSKAAGRDFAKGVLVLSCGVRTRDGSSLLVRFSTLNDRLEARALDCSGGAAGVVVLCAVPPEVRDDLIALRSLCEKLAPRLIVQDGQLVLGDALVDDYQAASRLQARIRGRNERLHPTKPPARTEDVAAAKLQSRIRGRNERATGRVAQDRAAASLQANVRGHKAREDVGPLDATAARRKRDARDATLAKAAARERQRLDDLAARRLAQKTRNPYSATPFEERTRRAELEAGLFRPVRSKRREGVLPALPRLPSSQGPTTTGRRQAMATAKRLGYVPKGELDGTYLEQWRTALRQAAQGSTERLASNVAAVRQAHRDVAPDVACCALADAEGSVAEARTRLGQLGYRRELDVVARTIDVRAVVLAARPVEDEWSPSQSEEESTVASKPISRKSPDRRMQLESVARLVHRKPVDDDLGAEIASLLALAAPPRRKRRPKPSPYFISGHLGAPVRHLGRWRNDLGRDPLAIPGAGHPVSLR